MKKHAFWVQMLYLQHLLAGTNHLVVTAKLWTIDQELIGS